MQLLTPAERCDVSVLTRRSAAVSLLEARADGGPDVGVGAPIEQETGEASVVRLSLTVVDQKLRWETTVEKSAMWLPKPSASIAARLSGSDRT